MRSVRHSLTVLVMAIGVIVAGSAWGQGQTPMQHQHKDEQTATKPPAPIHTTMEALHASGGVPKGWKFLVPPGDQARGREVFVTLECFACHTVKGEDFPKTSKRSQEPGQISPAWARITRPSTSRSRS